MSKKIKLPTGAEAEVVEHGEGVWFGRVPAALVDWDGTGSAESRLAETEAAWAEQIARNGEARKDNARKVTLEDAREALALLRRGRRAHITMTRLAAELGCTERTINRLLAAAGVSWKSFSGGG